MQNDLKWTGERIVTSIYWELAAEHLSRYAFTLDFCKGKRVLDAACGEGYGTAILSNYASSIVGVDIDKETIEHAQQKYKKDNVKFVASDVCKMPLPDNSFDVIVSFETLEHVDSHEALLNEFKRVLVPGGIMFISTPDKQYYTIEPNYHNPFHKKELFGHEFEALLKANFAHTKMFNQQNFLGAMIYSDEVKETVASAKKYEGSFAAIRKDESLNKPMYRIGVASDSPLPGLDNLFFQDKKIIQNSCDHIENVYKNTTSYKFGNAIVRPLNKLKSIFKKA